MRAELLVDAFYNHSLLSPLKLHIFRKGHSSGCHVRISIELLLCMGLWWLFSRDTPIAESTTLPVSASWNFMAWPMSIKDACSVITQLPKAGELRLFFIIPSPTITTESTDSCWAQVGPSWSQLSAPIALQAPEDKTSTSTLVLEQICRAISIG